MLVLGGEHSFNKAGTQPRRHYSFCIWVRSMLSHVQLLANPMDCSCQAPLSVGFPRQECSSGDGTYTSGISCVGRPILYHLHHLGSSLYLEKTQKLELFSFLPVSFQKQAGRMPLLPNAQRGSLQKH